MTKSVAGVVMGMMLGAVTMTVAEPPPASEAPAIRYSMGAGGYFTSDFGGGTKVQGIETSTPWYGGGLNLFFDMTYAEAAIGLTFGGGTTATDMPDIHDTDMSHISLDFGLMLRYPIPLPELGKGIIISPTAGINYRLAVSGKVDDKDYADAVDWSALWFNLGVCMDFALSEKMYLRPAVLYGIRLSNTAESDASDTGADVLLGHGLTVKVGVGYNF